jgi:hypothetical protein
MTKFSLENKKSKIVIINNLLNITINKHLKQNQSYFLIKKTFNLISE